MDEKKIHEFDKAIFQASRKINVLKTLTWPAHTEEEFLTAWRAGNHQLPNVKLEVPDHTAAVNELSGIARQCDQSDPVEKFLAETAESYADAGEMLMAIGTQAFTRHSSKIYGRPDMVYKYHGFTAVEGAKFFLEVTDNLLGNQEMQPEEFNISAEEFATWLKAEVDEFFDKDVVEVVIDQSMSSKALAGATRIRVRGSARFSNLDKDQLLFHEAFVHTATQLNGRKQKLKCLGIAAPRSTRTQEGLAVFAELVTNSMDITRLRRIALRVVAIDLALAGADFNDLFLFFLKGGQSEVESFRSAQRIFRGGGVKDQIVFTKDAMYLQGLIEVHTFFRVAIRDNRPDLIRNLFAGRMTMADVLRLTPLFQSGWLIPPVYTPNWVSEPTRLSAMMAYSAFISNIKLDKMYLGRAVEFEEEIKTALRAQ